MTFFLEEANKNDAESVAQVMLDVSNDDGQGTENQEVLTRRFLERVQSAMQSETQLYVVARQPRSRVIVGYAHYILPTKPGMETRAEVAPSREVVDIGSPALLRQKFLSKVMSAQSEHSKGEKYWDHFEVLASLATHPEYRKQGIASALANWEVGHASSAGLTLCLIVRTGNDNSMGLYARPGFEEFGRFECEMPGHSGKIENQLFICEAVKP